MARRKKGEIVNGWVNLDKPVGMTSTQAVGKVRRLLNAQKAGHAGTLDPLASGILPIALGEATKTIPFVQDGLKLYEFTITWGEQRDTDDSEGQIIATSPHRPSENDIKSALPRYTGVIRQTPPKFSAIKIDGQRAYDLARDGEEFEIEEREVYIENLQLCHPERSEGSQGDSSTQEGLRMTKTAFTMLCGKGTYVRALARDLARDLGTYGYISALRRTEVGPFTIENAISLDKLEALANSAGLNEALLPLQTALDDIPALALREDETARLRNGQILTFIARPDVERLQNAGLEIDQKGTEAVALYQGQPVALVEVSGVKIKPVRVLNL
jgi:tRNA pseudouridine55 synthase